MKIALVSCASLVLSLSFASAESVLEKVENGVSKAVKKTGEVVEKAVDKTGDALKDTGNSLKKSTETAETDVKKTGDKVEDSEIFQKVEKTMSKPFTPEQKQKYAEAWAAAQEKARATEHEFALKVSEITGVTEEKTKKIVRETGL